MFGSQFAVFWNIGSVSSVLFTTKYYLGTFGIITGAFRWLFWCEIRSFDSLRCLADVVMGRAILIVGRLNEKSGQTPVHSDDHPSYSIHFRCKLMLVIAILYIILQQCWRFEWFIQFIKRGWHWIVSVLWIEICLRPRCDWSRDQNASSDSRIGPCL